MIEQYDLSFLNLEKILKILQSSQAREHGLVSDGVSSYNYGMPILEHPELRGLKTIIQKHLNEYSSKPLQIINSWFNTMNVGDELKIHNHTNDEHRSVVSGAFYANVGENSVPLIFSTEQVKPRNGLLVLFSSEMEHYTEPEKEQRTVISFNTDYL
jgi:hypothetical protein